METSEKNKTQMAIIKDLVYEFRAKDKAPLDLNDKSKIFLVINDIETSIAIESLFIGGIEVDDEDVYGFSILQLLTDGTQLKIDENTILKITFIDKATGREFYISKIRRPLIYDENMEISTESRLRYIDLLLTTSMVPIEAEKEAGDKLRVEAERVEAERVESERVEAERVEAERVEAERVEAENERIRVESEKALILGGEFWKAQRKELIHEGMTEYAFENYRLFYKKGDDEVASEIGFFILVPGDYQSIDLFEEEITDEIEEYTFEDYKDDEVRVVFDKVEGTLTVEE